MPRGGPPIGGGGGQAYVPRGGGWQGGGQWQHGRRHFRHGPSFGFASPFYYGYATPYVYEEDCVRVRFIRGAYRRVWVCD